jgi:hypothetical protein
LPLRKLLPQESSSLFNRKVIRGPRPGRLRGTHAVVIRLDLLFGAKDFLIVIADEIFEQGDLVVAQSGNPAANLLVGCAVSEMGQQILHGDPARRKLRSAAVVHDFNRCGFHGVLLTGSGNHPLAILSTIAGRCHVGVDERADGHAERT